MDFYSVASSRPFAHGQISWIAGASLGPWVDLTDLKYMADCQEWKGQRCKKIYERKITQHEEKFFQPY